MLFWNKPVLESLARRLARIQDAYGLYILLFLIIAYLVHTSGHFGKRIFFDGQLLKKNRS